MSETIELAELRDAVRPALTDMRCDTWPIPGEDGRGFDRQLWQQCAELGWLQLSAPDDLGGLGLGLAHLSIVYEEMGRALASVPYHSTMLAAEVIAALPEGDERTRLLEAIAAGDSPAVIALPQTHASLKQDRDGTLSGTVPDVLFADIADLLVLSIDAEDGAKFAILHSGISGVSRTKRSLADLTRSAADVTLESVALADCSVVQLDEARKRSLFDHAALGLAADSVGAAHAVFELTLDYLNTREQFGRLIGSFQALKHRMADWKCRLETAAALSRHAALLADRRDAEASANASGAKFLACDVFAGVAADAIQLHGGIGFTWEHPCHLFLKRAKLSQQLFGSSTYHKERVSRFAFGVRESEAA